MPAPDPSKNLFFVLPSLTSGGAERVVSIISRGLSNAGYNVSIIVFNNKTISYKIDENVRIVQVGKGLGYNQKANIIFKLLDLRRIIKKSPGAILIPFHDSCLKYALRASRGLKAHVVACERNDPYHLYPTRKSARRIKHLYDSSEACVFQTQGACDFFGISDPQKCFIIKNPVTQPDYYWEGRILDRSLISVCRLSPQKNIPMAIDAVKKVIKKTGMSLSYHIYGQGELIEELQRYVESEGVSDAISFMGVTNNVQKELSVHSIFVMSSDYEGISNAMLEAMSVGMPVISTDCPIGGARETINNGRNGILVPVGDSEALSEAIIRVLQDYSFALKLGNNAKEVTRICSVESITNQWIQVIESL